MSEVYAITDLSSYVSQMRETAAISLSDSHEENLDSYINLQQMIGLVNKNCLGFDEKNRPLLNEDANAEIFGQTAAWIYNAGLAKLAAQDLIECAWDSEANEMIFWPKQKPSEEKTKNESQSKKNRKSKG
jgi:hypothetical protein